MKSIFRKSVEKIRIPLKSEKYNGSFTWKPIYIYGSISLDFVLRKNVSDKICGEN
jgi:hypothetical protein